VKENEKDFFGDTYSLFTNYVDDRLLLLRIQAAEKSGKLAGALIKMVVTAFLVSLILLFISITGGYYFAEITGSMVYGFGIIALLHIFLLSVFLLLNKQFISKRVMNMVIRIFFERSPNELELNEDDDE
jgi:hypothetical protein